MATLAGIIEHDQDDLAPAEKDLAEAVGLDPGNCTAIWYQALVTVKRQTWPAAAARFASAMTCYDGDARNTQQKLAELRGASNVDEDFRVRQIASFEAAIKEDRAQESASAYNAAVNYLRVRDLPRATEFADLAARDPARLEKVAELRKLIRDTR